MRHPKLCIGLISALIAPTPAFATYYASGVTITDMSSFNSGEHMWFTISGPTNCSAAPTTNYFILQRWDDQPEPIKTRRQVIYQMAMAAFMSGKKVNVGGASCYLGNYLFVDQIAIVP